MIIDVLDASDPKDSAEVTSLRDAGHELRVARGSSNLVAHVVGAIIQRAKNHQTIEVLRFHGAGASGVTSFAAGNRPRFNRRSESPLDPMRDTERELRRLCPYFASVARVELHGCDLPAGATGERVLRKLASIWRVPVSAGTQSRYEGPRNQLRFGGPVRTARPDGGFSTEDLAA